VPLWYANRAFAGKTKSLHEPNLNPSSRMMPFYQGNFCQIPAGIGSNFPIYGFDLGM